MKFECTRCHDIPNIEPAPERKHCVRCHQAIHAGTFEAKREHLDRWKKRIKSVMWVPSLAGADRLNRSWVQAFLLAPHDVRPGLIAEMPRLAITPDEAARIAAHLAPEKRGPSPLTDAPSTDAGEQLFRALACGRCHRFTGAAVDDVALHEQGRAQVAPLDGAWALAPDLRFARQRMTTESMAAWIEHPRGAMPALGVNADNARSLAAFIANAQLAPEQRVQLARHTQTPTGDTHAGDTHASIADRHTADTRASIADRHTADTRVSIADRHTADTRASIADRHAADTRASIADRHTAGTRAPSTDTRPPTASARALRDDGAIPARLPILARAVTYDEVDKRVFKNVCWHCHAVPDFARGDGGPGNSGGFGFAPRGLDVSSYEGLASGSLDERGERRSIFAKLPDGTPRIVAHLMARYAEEAGGSVEGVRGMPLGLPPLPLEEIQLVESWIAQGRPR